MDQGKLTSNVADLAARVPNGSRLAVAKTECGPAMAATRALVARGVRGLHLTAVPTSGLQADLLIGAGCVDTVEGSGITLGEWGQAPCFGRFVREGRGTVVDSTCPAVYAGLQAAEKGVPFLPMRGLIGTDILATRDDYRVIANPFVPDGNDDPIVAVKAIRPDVTLIHAALADRHGNVWIGRHKPAMLLAHAARDTLATVEALHDGNLLDDPLYGPATIPALYITAIAEAPRGAWPLAFTDHYGEDAEHMAEYLRLAASDEGFADYVDRYVRAVPAAAQ